ncbi:YigZ family protein [Caproiciproducens sp. R2]|uniref:YigZ family protein n=1 Tax=Caproiciproducens sp. R2 TaxID=3435187 RepID=UPI00403396AC
MVEYRTVKKEALAEFVERRSRFIGCVKPVKTEEEAVSFINSIKSKNWNASHNVYAYSLRQGQIRRYSDDGEPQGTAGIPVLDVLMKSGVVDTAVVVTRYFGGILLGAGGLVRAYSHGASIALEQAGIITMRTCLTVEVCCDYNQYGRVSALIPESGGTVDNAEFTDSVRLSFHMSDEDMRSFEQKLADATCGQCRAEVTGEKFFKFS